MYRKRWWIIWMMVVILVVGCEKEHGNNRYDDKIEEKGKVGAGIVEGEYDHYKYSLVKEVSKDELERHFGVHRDVINKLKGNKEGYLYKDGYIYLFLGVRNTGGYKLEVEKVKRKGDVLELFIKEIVPDKDKMVSQVLTKEELCLKVMDKDIKEVKINVEGKWIEEMEVDNYGKITGRL